VIGLYVHVPFCAVRCTYCDFDLVAGRRHDLDRFVEAACLEIEATAPPLLGRPADTVHLGGGTPSILPPALVGRILDAIRRTFRLDPEAEVALEANPEDLDDARCRDLMALGVNRLSIGVQSLDDALLARLRRSHTAATALAAVRVARDAGMRSVGADLILGLPGQHGDQAVAGIERLIEAGVDHLSLYLLEVHDRTRLGREVALGRLATMRDDDAAELYEEAALLVETRGFEHYEISNFARPGKRSRHNLKYWTDQEYLGFGPSAHSYALGQRWSNVPGLPSYLERRGAGCARLLDSQPSSVRGAEALVAGLRIAEGIDLGDLRERYGPALPAPEEARVAALVDAGLADLEGTRLRLTRRGRLVSNEVCERLLPARMPGDLAVS